MMGAGMKQGIDIVADGWYERSALQAHSHLFNIKFGPCKRSCKGTSTYVATYHFEISAKVFET